MHLFLRCTVRGSRSTLLDSVCTASIAVAAAIARPSPQRRSRLPDPGDIRNIAMRPELGSTQLRRISLANSLELESRRLAQRSRLRRALRHRQRSRDSNDTPVIAIRSEQQGLCFRRISHRLRTISPAPSAIAPRGRSPAILGVAPTFSWSGAIIRHPRRHARDDIACPRRPVKLGSHLRCFGPRGITCLRLRFASPSLGGRPERRWPSL